MIDPGTELRPGRTRPVYLWAGNATIALQQVKFPDIPIDVAAHIEAYQPIGLRALSALNTNLAFLSMNWGFPPEIERQHWDEFAQAVQACRVSGIAVLGYVQTSNCVSAGSYQHADWYARDRTGRRVPYYHGRFMTCWNEPRWLAEVEAHALRVLAAGADGVFFDNLWMGATPWTLGRAVSGFAGCACARCRQAYHADTGAHMPFFIDAGAASTRYLIWRAQVVRTRFARWRSVLKEHAPQTLVIANNCDVILRDTTGLFGLDLQALSSLQDALLIENVAMPHYHAGRRRLVANALVLKAVRAIAPDKPILALTYERGIGLDRLPGTRRLRRTFAEAVAVGAVPVLKGSEFIDHAGRFSVITAPAFGALRVALAPLLDWLHGHAWLFDDVQPAPAVCVPYLPRATGAAWLANKQNLAAALALLRAQVPFAFTAGDAPCVGPGSFAHGGRAHPLLDSAHFCRLIDPGMRALARGYFGTVRLRRWIDKSGLTRRFLESPSFALPDNWGALRTGHDLEGPCAFSAAPILVERWRHTSGRYRLHVVNYCDQPVDVTVKAGGPIVLHSPDPGTVWLDSAHARLRLDTYAVLECD
jgi:hypothetical protein